MLLSKLHIINITSRNITKWSNYLGYKVERGELEVTSEQVMEMNVAKTKLDCVCERCGKNYQTVSCKAKDKPRKLVLCESCGRSDDLKVYYKTEEGKKKSIKCGISIKNSENHKKSRKLVTDKFRSWLTTEAGNEFINKLIVRVSVDFVKYGSDNGRWNPDKDDLKAYRRIAYRHTYRNKPIYSTWENYDKIGKSGITGAYQLDHIIPIKYGFDNNICPSVIGHIDNLQIIPWKENRSKWDKI